MVKERTSRFPDSKSRVSTASAAVSISWALTGRFTRLQEPLNDLLAVVRLSLAVLLDDQQRPLFDLFVGREAGAAVEALPSPTVSHPFLTSRVSRTLIWSFLQKGISRSLLTSAKGQAEESSSFPEEEGESGEKSGEDQGKVEENRCRGLVDLHSVETRQGQLKRGLRSTDHTGVGIEEPARSATTWGLWQRVSW